MTKNNEQIIIDGVNVRECKYFNKYQKIVRNNEVVVDIQNACIERNETVHCNRRCNCYYKNWQRKEQECKNNKTAHQIELDIYNQECLNLQEELKETLNQLDQLKKENEELKAENSTYKSSIMANLDKNISKRYRELLEENDQLKQTLEETREIAGQLYYHAIKDPV